MHHHFEAIREAWALRRGHICRALVCAVGRGLRTPIWNGGGYWLQIYLNIHGAPSILIFSFLKDGCVSQSGNPSGKKNCSFLPCRVQLSRTKLGWKPLRPLGLFIIHKCCTPASWIHLDRLLLLHAIPDFITPSARKEAGSIGFLQEWSVKMGFV